MSFEVKEVSYCKLSVNVNFDSDKIEEKRSQVLNEFKKFPVPGNRPGKASIDAIKHRYRAQIDARLREALAEEAYHGAVTEKELKTLGNPEFTSLSLNENSFSCSFNVNTKPTFELSDYKAFSLPKPKNNLSAEEFAESLLQELRERNGETVPFGDDDFVQKGDSVIIDYVGIVDGVERSELTAKKEVITIGSSPFPAFDENLLGMKVGEERSFDVPAPSNASVEYANKTITFKVTLALGSKTTPAPLDDELAKRLNFTDLQSLRSHVGSVATQRTSEHEKALLLQQISARLVENHNFQIPSWLTTGEAQLHCSRAGLKWDEITDERKEEFLSQAEKSIKLSLVLEKIRENEIEAQLSDEELNQFIDRELVNLARSNEQADVDNLRNQIHSSGMLPVLIGKIRDDYTLNYLLGTSTVVE